MLVWKMRPSDSALASIDTVGARPAAQASSDHHLAPTMSPSTYRRRDDQFERGDAASHQAGNHKLALNFERTSIRRRAR